jgi:hypothetical protein
MACVKHSCYIWAQVEEIKLNETVPNAGHCCGDFWRCSCFVVLGNAMQIYRPIVDLVGPPRQCKCGLPSEIMGLVGRCGFPQVARACSCVLKNDFW